jgi:hypothetical protein
MKALRFFFSVGIFVLTFGLVTAGLAAAQNEPVQPTLPGSSGPLESGEPAQPEQAGGPDAFGYTFKDSSEPGGPVFSWEDVTGGTLATGWTDFDNGYAGPFPIGFDFNYYGNTYDEFYIGTNGYISFGSGAGTIPWGILPSTESPNNDIALFGDDLYLYGYEYMSAIYYQTLSNPNRLVVEFVNIYYCCGYNTSHTFEVILYPDGNIVSQYAVLGGTTTSHVGIEDSNGTVGLRYGSDLSDGLAIRYEYPQNVYLFPSTQAGYETGTTATYSVALKNSTGNADVFELSFLPGNAWAATLSLTQTAVISDGASISFTVGVNVPITATLGENDDLTIQATSATSPTVYSSTASLNTTAISGEWVYAAVSEQPYPGPGDYDYLSMIDAQAKNVVNILDARDVGCQTLQRVAIPPNGNTVWASCLDTGNVLVIDRETHRVLATPGGGNSPQAIAFTQDSNFALIASYDGSVTVLDTTTYLIQAVIPVYEHPTDILVHPYLPVAYVVSQAPGSQSAIHIVNTESWNVEEVIAIEHVPLRAVISLDGSRLYIGSVLDDLILVFDTAIKQITGSIQLTDIGFLRDLELSQNGQKLFAMIGYDYGAGFASVVVVDTQNLIIEHTTYLDPNNSSVYEGSLSCDGSELWVSAERQVAVLDASTYIVDEYIPFPDIDGDGSPDRYGMGIALCPQYLADELMLIPPAQSGQGGRGQRVTYEETLLNLTGAADTFTLTLGASAWDTSISAASSGLVPDEGTFTFTVGVTIPVGVDWYATDTVAVTATSVASPTGYVDRATFTTQAYLPPDIEVSPDALTSTQFVNEIVTHTLTISNGDGVTLTYILHESSLPGGLPHILAWIGFASSEYNNALAAISQYTDYTLDVLSTPYPAPEELAAALEDADVFLIPDQDYGWAGQMHDIGYNWHSVLGNFLSEGKDIVILDDCNVGSNILNGAGLMDVNWVRCLYGQTPLEVTAPRHPYGYNLPSEFMGESNLGTFGASSSQQIVRVRDLAETIVASRQLFGGRVGLIGLA